ncbi:MAG: hypothetical protein JWQ04_3156 [Pedosphaera sp.]|nr:hypothetical protein [Pedosphaera sp.]
MRLSSVKQSIGQLEATLADNPVMTVVLIIAIGLAVLILGGVLLDTFLEKRRARQKAKAVERLHKHLASLPNTKS